MKKISISIVILLVCYAVSFGQEKVKTEPYKNWEVGINAGVVHFTGEYDVLKDDRINDFNYGNSDMDIGYGALVEKNFSHAFDVGARWNNPDPKGSWKFMSQTVPDFETQLNDFNRKTGWNINNIFSKNKFDRKIYWYAKIGLGITHLKRS